MSKIIPKEKLAGVQRWKIDSFDSPGPVTSAPAPSTPVRAGTPAAMTRPAAQNTAPPAEDIERLREAARQAGYREGLEAGRSAGEQMAREAASAQAEQFGNLLDGLQQALDRVDQEVADQLLELALEIASQVIRGSLATHEELLLPIIREAISALPLHHTHSTVRMHPDDVALVRPLLGDYLAQSGTQIIEDAEISRGGCQVRAGTSEVDATIETRWKRVLEAIGMQPKAWLKS